jgi:adenosylcobinamide-GDP ribazoletransferase
MKCLESLIVAFSMYSKIPMPQITWTKENMKNTLCYFPLIGAVIGALLWLWYWLCGIAGFGVMLQAAVAVLIPVLVTGGIHLDGFLDTSDALSSWQTTERRLEILKDPHTGAFAIIACCSYFLAAFGIWTEAKLLDIGILGIGFILSRTLSSFGVCKFPCAKKSGLAATFAEAADRKRCTIVLIIEMILCMAAMIWLDPLRGAFACAAAVLVCLGCRHLSMQKFGGITGDTQGFFLQVCELVMAFVVILIP